MTGGMWAYLIVLCFLFTVAFLAARSITKDIKRRDAEEEHRMEEGTTLNIALTPESYRLLKSASEHYGMGVEGFVVHSAMDKAITVEAFCTTDSKGQAPSDNSSQQGRATI